MPEEDLFFGGGGGGGGRKRGGGEAGRMIASEQQFVHNAKPIGKRPPSAHELAHEHIVLVPDAGGEEEAFPSSSELEDLREALRTSEDRLRTTEHMLGLFRLCIRSLLAMY